MPYSETHRLFKIEKQPISDSVWGSEEADMCKKHFGNDHTINEPLHKRKWFSSFDGIWIRNDCLDNEVATWFALREQ
jgi:hypothetical protein